MKDEESMVEHAAALVTTKPRVFIGSSKEGLAVAGALGDSLSRVAQVDIWDQCFEIGQLNMEALAEQLSACDFAVLVLTGDDMTTSRGRRTASPRDNVVFEAGLFMGKLGRRRALLLREDRRDMKLPSDWDGLTMATYRAAELRRDPRQAVRKAAGAIRRALRRRPRRKEVEFIRSMLEFIEPETKLNDSYSELLSLHYGRICGELVRLEDTGDWATLLEVKQRLRDYFEFTGKYDEGARHGMRYVRALQELGLTHEARWTRVKHVGYLTILSGKHSRGRKEIGAVLREVGPRPANAAVAELLFYCYRYLGISYMRDESAGSLPRAEELFDQAREIVKWFEKRHKATTTAELTARILCNQGNLDYRQKRYGAATAKYTRSLELFRVLDDEEHIGICHLKIAQSLVATGKKLEVAAGHLDSAERAFIDVGWVEGQGRVAYQYGLLYELRAARARANGKKRELRRDALQWAVRARRLFERIDHRMWRGFSLALEERLSGLAR